MFFPVEEAVKGGQCRVGHINKHAENETDETTESPKHSF
jgi:hypothetical protein